MKLVFNTSRDLYMFVRMIRQDYLIKENEIIIDEEANSVEINEENIDETTQEKIKSAYSEWNWYKG